LVQGAKSCDDREAVQPAGDPDGRPSARPVFDTPNILWFFGALTAAAAGVAVIGSVHSSARGLWILLVSLGFIAAYAIVSAALLQAGWEIPGGVVAATAVTFVPVATGAFERLVGIWRNPSGPGPFQEFEGPDVALLVATAVGGLVVYTLVRFPFVFAYVAGATFLTAQLLVPVFVSRPSLSDHATAVLVVGIALLGVGIFSDLRDSRRTGFWWHAVGLVTMTVGLAYHAFSHTSWGWVVILIVGAIVLALAAPLHRATWGLFGVAGTYAPIAHYTDKWFGNLGTAFALAAVGFALLGIGIAIQRAGDSWTGLLARRARA
jgi:hypothetical protein